MHTKSLIAATFALVTAAPAGDAKKPYIAVSLFVHIHPPHHFAYEVPAPTPLYHLYNYRQQKYVTELVFESDYHFGVPINAVECQAYSDALGQEPIGTFTNEHPLKFRKPTTVGSVICYAKPV